MSRIGNQPIIIPNGVTLSLTGNIAVINGPKGQLQLTIPEQIVVEIKDKEVIVKNNGKTKETKALHGLIRALLYNIIAGVSKGWTKTLQLVGVGYRVETDSKKLTLHVGFSHTVTVKEIPGITFSVTGNDVIIAGYDKQLVGETAAKIRRIKPPEVYKGKGIRYKNEIIRKKPGKAAKTTGAGTGITAK